MVESDAFAINKEDRCELFKLRQKWQDLVCFLGKKGISLVEIEKEQIEGDKMFNEGLCADLDNGNGNSRDEFGLPILVKHGTSDNKDFAKDTQGLCTGNVGKMFGIMSGRAEAGTSGTKNALGQVTMEDSTTSNADKLKKPSTWAQIVNDAPPQKRAKFSFVPLPAGLKVVTPPDDVLKKGNDKFKTTIVGKFTKGTVSFSKVKKFAHSMWEKEGGLLGVAQKDNRTFHFKFDMVANMNKALSRGTWYLDKQPLVMFAWGSSVGSVKSLPLWVRFEQVPDCYWTEEELSALASSIGTPLYADDLTSNLEVLPYAKMCVEYTVGNDFPSKVDVTVMDPVSDEKSISTVLVSYPNKPLVCMGCKTLGHLIGACPMVTRKWVRKDKSVDVEVDNVSKANPTSSEHFTKVDPGKLNAGKTKVVGSCDNNAELLGENLVNVADGWQTVGKKKFEVDPVVASTTSPVQTTEAGKDVSAQVMIDRTSTLCNESPPPVANFKNLKVVDEIDTKRAAKGVAIAVPLTKSQKKRARLALRGSPS